MWKNDEMWAKQWYLCFSPCKMLDKAGLRAGFRTGQAGKLPRGLHKQGASICFVTFYFIGILGLGGGGPPQLHC